MLNITSTLSYQPGQLIIAKAQSRNLKGWSIESEENTVGIVAQTSPTAAPQNFSDVTTAVTVQLSWSAQTLNTSIGFSSIVNYTILWDKGANDWEVNQVVPASLNTYTIGGLQEGNTYKFRIYSTNIHGDGPLSNILTT